MFPIGCNECGRKTPCSTCQNFNDRQDDQARARELAYEAALTRRRQGLGPEPAMGDVTRARETQLKEGEERLTREAEEPERKYKEEEEALARAAEEAERKYKEEEEALARAAEEAERKFKEEQEAYTP